MHDAIKNYLAHQTTPEQLVESLQMLVDEYGCIVPLQYTPECETRAPSIPGKTLNLFSKNLREISASHALVPLNFPLIVFYFQAFIATSVLQARRLVGPARGVRWKLRSTSTAVPAHRLHQRTRHLLLRYLPFPRKPFFHFVAPSVQSIRT